MYIYCGMSPQQRSCFVDNHNQIQTICYFYIKRGLALLFLLYHIEQANQCLDTELIGGLDKKSPWKIQFRYSMESLNKDWKDPFNNKFCTPSSKSLEFWATFQCDQPCVILSLFQFIKLKNLRFTKILFWKKHLNWFYSWNSRT